jgi:hypothetical protein
LGHLIVSISTFFFVTLQIMHREWVTGQVYSEHKTGRGKTQVGWLEVTFKLGLAHPLLVLHTASAPLQINLADTGNIVCIDPPGQLPNTEARFGAFDLLRLRIRRECTDEEGRSASLAEFRKWKILSDAGKVLWWFFETVRESDFRENNSLSGYPVAPAEEIQDNALVKTCDLESSYDGAPSRLIPLSSIPSIRITERAWKEAERRLSAQERVLPHWNFALDAAYFCQNDPIRAVIMACAAWETALRYYLANVASLRDPAYLVASRGGNLPRLLEFIKVVKGACRNNSSASVSKLICARRESRSVSFAFMPAFSS